jgi:hypothetical protein
MRNPKKRASRGYARGESATTNHKATARPSRPARGLASRVRGPDVACLTSYVPPSLALRLRVRAAEEGRTASAIVSEALERFLA